MNIEQLIVNFVIRLWQEEFITREETEALLVFEIDDKWYDFRWRLDNETM